MSKETKPASAEDRIAAFKPQDPTDGIAHHVVERAMNRGPKLAARFNLGRGGWAAVAGTAAMGIVATAIFLPALNTGAAKHGGYLFATGGGTAPTADGANSKMSMGLATPSFIRHLVPGDKLSSQASTGHIYQLKPAGDAAQMVNQLADYLGVTGETTFVKGSGIGGDIGTYRVGPKQDTGSGSGSAGGTGTVSSGTVSSGPASSGDVFPAVVQDPDVSVVETPSANQISYWAPMADEWSTCHMGMTPLPEECTNLPAGADIPTPYAGMMEAKAILAKIGITAGTNLSNLSDGDYLLTYLEPNSVAEISVDHAGTSNAPITKAEAIQNLLVNAALIVEGKPTAITIDFNWSYGFAKIASIYGSVSQAVDRGSYDTLSEVDTVKRLEASSGIANDYYGASYLTVNSATWNNDHVLWSKYTYMGSHTTYGGDFLKAAWDCQNPDAVNTSGESSAPGSAPDSGSSAGSVGVATGAPAPAPTDAPVPTEAPSATAEPQPSPTSVTCPYPVQDHVAVVTVTVETAKSTLLALYANDNTQWLVPGFELFDEDGGYIESAFSVVDGVIDVSQPNIQPMTR